MSGELDSIGDDGGTAGEGRVVLNVPFQIQKTRGAVRLLSPSGSGPTRDAPNPVIVKQLVRGNEWARWLLTGQVRSVKDVANKEGVTSTYVSRLVRYAFMAPEISEAILQGTADVNLATLGQAGELPLDWKRQRQLVGI